MVTSASANAETQLKSGMLEASGGRQGGQGAAAEAAVAVQWQRQVRGQYGLTHNGCTCNFAHGIVKCAAPQLLRALDRGNARIDAAWNIRGLVAANCNRAQWHKPRRVSRLLENTSLRASCERRAVTSRGSVCMTNRCVHVSTANLQKAASRLRRHAYSHTFPSACQMYHASLSGTLAIPAA